MKKYLILLTVFAIPVLALAQDDMAYLDDYLEICKKRDASFVKKLVAETEAGFEARVETMDGAVRVTGVYKDRGLTIENGQFTYFYDNGQIESQGEYIAGLKAGVWKRFDASGNPKADKIYDIEATADIPLKEVSNPPLFNPDYESLEVYLKNTMHTGGKRVKGSVKVEFTVERDGSVSNIYLLEGINETFDVRLRDALVNMPRWKAGKHCGSPVRVTRQETVKF
jgi:hypothetical protein